MNQDNQSEDISDKLLQLLKDSGLFPSTNIDNVITESPEYRILQIVADEKIINLDDLIDKLNLRQYLIERIHQLVGKSIVTFDNDLISFDDTAGIILPKSEKPMAGMGIGIPSIKNQPKSSEMTKSPVDDDLDSLFDDVLGESIEDFVSDFETLYVKSEGGGTGEIPVLIELLKDKGYFKDIEDETAMSKEIPYLIVRGILEQHPISTEEIEAKIEEDVPISMYLSNLRSDDIIDQTNDYRWTLSKKTFKTLKDYVQKMGGSDSEDQDAIDMKLFSRYIQNEDQQFIMACIDLGYVYHPGMELQAYLENSPEVEVLNVVRKQGPITDIQVRDSVKHALPVVVKRMISRLDADKVIKADNEGKWAISARLKFLMTKDQLKSALDEDEFEELEERYS